MAEPGPARDIASYPDGNLRIQWFKAVSTFARSRWAVRTDDLPRTNGRLPASGPWLRISHIAESRFLTGPRSPAHSGRRWVAYGAEPRSHSRSLGPTPPPICRRRRAGSHPSAGIEARLSHLVSIRHHLGAIRYALGSVDCWVGTQALGFGHICPNRSFRRLQPRTYVDRHQG